MGDPEGLNTHEHSEQPQPQKLCSSIHTSLRRMASLAHLAIWRLYDHRDCVFIVFRELTGEEEAVALRGFAKYLTGTPGITADALCACLNEAGWMLRERIDPGQIVPSSADRADQRRRPYTIVDQHETLAVRLIRACLSSRRPAGVIALRTRRKERRNVILDFLGAVPEIEILLVS